jgi:hypothetical protein
VRGVRHRIEDARDEWPAAVGLDDLDLEAVTGVGWRRQGGTACPQLRQLIA